MHNKVKAADHIRVEPQKKLKHAVVYSSTVLLLMLQGLAVVLLYAILAYLFPIFWYVSLALTAVVFIVVAIFEKRMQIKISWLILLTLSCGFGYILYFLSRKKVCFFIGGIRYSKILKRYSAYEKPLTPYTAQPQVKRQLQYINFATGCAPSTGCELKYFEHGTTFFNDFLERLESARKFVFIEFFIFAECKLQKRLCEILKRKAAQGVEVRILYDGMGSLGMIENSALKDLHKSGVKTAVFLRLATLFSFSLNIRDHRKIIVVDGKTGYVGGSNIADECINESASTAQWKDAGLRIDGAAADNLTISFLRQWDFVTRKKTQPKQYLNLYEIYKNSSNVLPYYGGPELKQNVCRDVYENLISDSEQKLYIMTPYLAPDGKMLKAIMQKARAGTDVKIILPSVPDWKFLYSVTLSNAQKLIKSGAKVYFLENTFAHSKVVLTDHAVAVGSVNFDMRSFYLEYDNGVYTDDKAFMSAARQDFETTIKSCTLATAKRTSIISKAGTLVLRLFSPLM